jgi:beta-mannosidase
LRLLDFDGTPRRDERSAVTLAALAATPFAGYSDAEVLGDADPLRTVAIFELLVDGQVVSRHDVYFGAAKDLAL